MAAPYDRLENETDPAFQAFTVYRDLGADRTIAAAAEACQKSVSLLNGWSQRHKWRRRCHSWDNAVDQRKRKAELRAVEDMRKRQINLAMGAQSLASRELKKLLKRSDAHPGKSAVKPEQIVRLMEAGTKIERLNRGEPGEIVAEVTGEDLTHLSVDELRALRSVRAKLRPPETPDDDPQ